MERSTYEGRKAQKRMKALERQIEKVRKEVKTGYEGRPELTFLEEDIRWDDTAELIFAIALRNVHFRWDGLRDYGFIRLCGKWIREREMKELRDSDVASMLTAILPAKMCSEIREEMEAAEF